MNLENWHGLYWTSDLTWSKNKNEIVSLFGGTGDDIGNGWFVGHPIDVHYEYEFDWIWQLDLHYLAIKRLRPETFFGIYRVR